MFEQNRSNCSLSSTNLTRSDYTSIPSNIPLLSSSHPETLLPDRAHHNMGKCVCEITCGRKCLNRTTYAECTARNCRAIGCTNRSIQRGMLEALEVFDTGTSKGMGLRCENRIGKGSFIAEYVGEVFDKDSQEGRERWRKNLEDKIFYMMKMYGEMYVDASRYGNLSRFINHSCEPNATVEVWEVDYKFKMAVFACRDIEPMEEITYNYGRDFWIQTRCLCGAAKCVSGLVADVPMVKLSKTRTPRYKYKANITFPSRYLLLLHQLLTKEPYATLSI